MRKRILSIFMAIAVCISMLPAVNVVAAVQTQISAETAVSETESAQPKQVYSNWALEELLTGDTYGIYPLTWYKKDLAKPITQSQLRVLISGMKKKLVATECVIRSTDINYKLNQYNTVEKVLKTMHAIIYSYDYNKSVGMENQNAITYAKKNGIFTGKGGELGLKDVCSVEQACVFATRYITLIYNELDAASKGFLWVAKKGDNTVYMLGSIHMASNDIYPLSEKILNAYHSSDKLALELNMYDTEGAKKLAALGVYTDGTTLKDHVSKETYDKTIDMAGTYGYSEAQIMQLKPWYLYSMFNAISSTDTGSVEQAQTAVNLGIDINFNTDALLFNKPILEVEGFEYQGKVLDSFSDELEEYLLAGTIDTINGVLKGEENNSSDDLQRMLKAWHEGDLEALKKLVSFEYEYSNLYDTEQNYKNQKLLMEFKEKLLVERDKHMAEYIEKLLTEEGSTTYFVVVGSAHYISNYSVIDILKDKGYIINRIQ